MKLIMLMLVLIFSSCSTNKALQKEKIKEKTTIDSTFNHIKTKRNVEIEWILSDDSIMMPYFQEGVDSTSSQHPKITRRKIPKYGRIKIKISNDSIRSQGEIKATTKKITKNKKKKKNQVLKPQKAQNHFNFLYIIIFAFCVKYLWNHRNIFKKIWNFIK